MYGIHDLWRVNPEWRKMYGYAMGPVNGVNYPQPNNTYTPGLNVGPTVQNDDIAFLHLRQNMVELPILDGSPKFGGDHIKQKFQICSRVTQDPATCVAELWNKCNTTQRY